MTPYWSDEKAGIELYLGDCREVLPTLGAVDHVVTDPPYARDIYQRAAGIYAGGFGYRELKRRGESLAKMAAGEIGCIDEMLAPIACEIGRLTRRWGIVFSDVETCHVWRAALEGAQMRYIRTGAWVKTDPMPQFSGDRPAVGFEPCTIVHAQGKLRWNGGGFPATWLHGTAKGDERPDHPCPKPLPLMVDLVSLFTDPGETILDPFMGSGTTGVASKRLGRRFVGVELEEKWCEAAARRIERTSFGVQEAMAL